MHNAVSVITVCYNDCAHLQQTLSSLRDLKHPPAEVIIIDGGSTDCTRDFLRRVSLGDTALRIISERDRGIYDAMNKGVRLARGQLLHFLNAGDIVFGEPYAGAVGPGLLPVTVRQGDLHYRQRVPSLFVYSYCHQGILFPAGNIEYDLRYTISADLDYVMRAFPRGLARLAVSASGGVIYDLNGVSQRAKAIRDREMIRIYLRRRCWALAGLFAAGMVAKHALGSSFSRAIFAHGFSKAPERFIAGN